MFEIKVEISFHTLKYEVDLDQVTNHICDSGLVMGEIDAKDALRVPNKYTQFDGKKERKKEGTEDR